MGKPDSHLIFTINKTQISCATVLLIHVPVFRCPVKTFIVYVETTPRAETLRVLWRKYKTFAGPNGCKIESVSVTKPGFRVTSLTRVWLTSVRSLLRMLALDLVRLFEGM